MQTIRQFMAECIEQLDLALDQLALCDRNHNRFALMLIDNVIELALHRKAEELMAERRSRWRASKHDPRLINAALGKGFKEKVKLANAIGWLTAEDAESILYLHDFRNTAYHLGLRHEGILHPLTCFYLRLAGQLLAAHQYSGWSSSSNATIPLRAKKYVGEAASFDDHPYRNAALRLADVTVSLDDSLVSSLASDMAATVEEANQSLEFLTSLPGNPTRDTITVDAQAWHVMRTEAGRKFVNSIGCKDMHPLQAAKSLGASFPLAVRRDPIPRWEARVASLEIETNKHLALRKYCQFMRQTESVRIAIYEHATGWDREIQLQIDIARGK